MGRSDSSISGVCKFIINEDGDIYYSYSTSNAINFENTFLKVRFKLSAGNYKLVLTTTDENNSDSTNTQ